MIAVLSRDWPEPMPVEQVLRELASATIDGEHDVRVTDTTLVMLLREGERASLPLAGEASQARPDSNRPRGRRSHQGRKVCFE